MSATATAAAASETATTAGIGDDAHIADKMYYVN